MLRTKWILEFLRVFNLEEFRDGEVWSHIVLFELLLDEVLDATVEAAWLFGVAHPI